jgi:hypothetical protein
VNVTKLKWKKRKALNGEEYYVGRVSETSLGEYTINLRNRKAYWDHESGPYNLREAGGLNAAKKACQQDYESRVLALLVFE